MNVPRLVVTAVLVGAAPLGAQQVPVSERAVQGRVLRPARAGNLPVAGVWVTLHRVGSDAAGPIDSLLTAANGIYRFRYRPTGDENATYFVTASHSGIAYFAAPLSSADVRGEEGEITVFDTTSAPVYLRVRGRHIAAAARSGARRTVIEVYEISNDTVVTRVAGARERPTFVALFPEAAQDVRVGEGDVPSEATRTEKGRLLVFAPVAPGLKQLSFSYTLGDDDFPLTVPVRDSIDVFEVLLEDPAATAEGAGLKDLGEVSTEGRRFHRFLAQDVGAGSSVRVSIPDAPSPARWGLYVTMLASVIVLAMFGAFTRAMLRPARVATRNAPGLRQSESIAREIAEMDERAARDGALATDDLSRAREALKDRLVRALAAESGQT